MPFKNFPTSPRLFSHRTQHPWRKAKLTVLGSPLAPCNKSSLPSVFPLLIVLLLSSKEGGENLGKDLLFLEKSRPPGWSEYWCKSLSSMSSLGTHHQEIQIGPVRFLLPGWRPRWPLVMVLCVSFFSYIIMRTQTLALYSSSGNLQSGHLGVEVFDSSNVLGTVGSYNSNATALW